LLFNLTMLSVLAWLTITVFVWWRRSASNLTPVNAAKKNNRAEPDFLSVDSKAREAAEARGEAYGKALDRQEKEAAKAEARGGRPARSTTQHIAGLVSFLMSLFTLATMIFGAIWQVSRMGQLMQEYSTTERIFAVIQNHPISFSIAALVIGFQIFRFFSDRQWKES
jgi:hypothetical protein